MVACWWFFCIIVTASYSGNLIAHLTVVTDQVPFDTLRQMAETENIKWGTVDGTSMITYLQVERFVFLTRSQGLISFRNTDPETLNIKVMEVYVHATHTQSRISIYIKFRYIYHKTIVK